MSIEKRVFDVLFSTLALAVLWRLFLAIAHLIKLEDDGPGCFRQGRVGHRGRLFRIWKFRTMVTDPASHRVRLTVGEDARVTGVRRRRRKPNLDERPQQCTVLT